MKILVLTNHKKHLAYQAIYPMLRRMSQDNPNAQIDILSRGFEMNEGFFNGFESPVEVVTVEGDFSYHENGLCFAKERRRLVNPRDYDFVWLRTAHVPGIESFYGHLFRLFEPNRILNHPFNSLETGAKSYLLNFKDLTPPIQSCKNIEDVKAFCAQFETVLKPQNESCGRGLVRVQKECFLVDGEERPIADLEKYLQPFFDKGERYLAMKFLKNVSEGDKRIVVAGGEIVSSFLRKPRQGEWLCNLFQGATADFCDVAEEEYKIVKEVDKVLRPLGVVLYGIDTLMDDDGKRVLSEINTLNTGVACRSEGLEAEEIYQKVSKQMWSYLENKFSE